MDEKSSDTDAISCVVRPVAGSAPIQIGLLQHLTRVLVGKHRFLDTQLFAPLSSTCFTLHFRNSDWHLQTPDPLTRNRFLQALQVVNPSCFIHISLEEKD